AEVLNSVGRAEEALRFVEQAMRLNPHYPPWYLVESGVAYLLRGRYTEAITMLKTGLHHNPDVLSAYVFLSLGSIEEWAAQLTADPQALTLALTAAQRAAALNDAAAWVHIPLGLVYLVQKQYEAALAEMERAIALDPNVAWGYANLALVLSNMGKVEE